MVIMSCSTVNAGIAMPDQNGCGPFPQAPMSMPHFIGSGISSSVNHSYQEMSARSRSSNPSYASLSTFAHGCSCGVVRQRSS